LSETEREAVVEVLHSPTFVNMAPAAIFATLLDEGKYLCSVRTMYRILASLDEVRERRAIARRPAYKKPELLASGPNQVWSWDITKLKTFEKWVYFYLYVLMDIFSRYVVGYLIAERESGELARELILESCEKQGIVPGTLTIHSDRGTPMKSKTVSMLYTDLGIDKSLSRPSVSDDNPFSEAQFKTVKYCPRFLERTGTIHEARDMGRDLVTWYNCEHKHSGIGYYTPEQVHYGKHVELQKTRAKALSEAYSRNPERFKLMPKPQAVPNGVWINPPKLEGVSPGLVVGGYEKTASGIFVKK
jgi:putative transposase